MEHMFDSWDYHWCLFMGHLVIEKLLKACYVKNVDKNVPRIHNLVRLAELAGITLDDTQREILTRITLFNINARYPDQKQQFYRMATREYTATQIGVIKEVREWLLSILSKQSSP